ncbi:MAG: 30S ribosomal protein S6 [Miltoncostaeaceae bacterium]|jgi:small subunit ribosomal protein S6
MMILSTEADGEQHAEIISRVSTLIDEAGGTVDDVAEWGRRPIAYPVRKQTDGVYVIVTCQAEPAAIDEVCRILSISKEVVLRAMPFRLSDAELEAAKANGVPLPVDDRPAEERPRGGRGGRGGGAGGGRRRDRDR